MRESYAHVVHVGISVFFSRFIKVRKQQKNCVITLLWLNHSLDLDLGSLGRSAFREL